MTGFDAQARAIERVVRARMIQQDTGTFGLILRDDEAAGHIAAALRAARKDALEEAARAIEDTLVNKAVTDALAAVIRDLADKEPT